jgi:hypothetical protein
MAYEPGATQRATDSSGSASSEGIVEQAKQTAHEAAHEARHQAENQLNQQKQAAAGSLRSVADALHAAGDRLEDDDQGTFANYAHAAAEQVEQFTYSIRSRSVGDILDEAQRFARREPALFIGGAFLIGLVGARFLKASDQQAGGTGSYRGTDMGSRGFQGRTGRSDYGHSMPRYGEATTEHGRPLVSGTEGARIPDPGREPAVRRTESSGAGTQRGSSSGFGTTGGGTTGSGTTGMPGGGSQGGGMSGAGTLGSGSGTTGSGTTGTGAERTGSTRPDANRGDSDSPSRNL